jgi:sugar (pentulose or hexulose) kinase
MDASTHNYREDLIQLFQDKYHDHNNHRPLSELLPEVVVCGNDAGTVTPEAAVWLGLPPATIGIPVAAAEGDQTAALVGSLIGEAGMVSCSFGTSVCANLVGGSAEDSEAIRSPMVNHFSAANGNPIYMVWLRNGTTYFNTMVKSYSPSPSGDLKEGENENNAFDSVMPQVISAPADCGGLLAMPFMDDEPGLGVTEGGTATLIGWNPTNATVGNACKAALLGTMFNLKKGMNYLKEKGVTMRVILLSGGLAKTPEMGQVVADVFGLPVRLLQGAEEGCSWGAAVLAKYRCHKLEQTTSKDSTGANTNDWIDFLKSITTPPMQSFHPYPPDSALYELSFQKYQNLLELQPKLQQALSY